MSYYISVGEPWDFTSPDGENIILGSIISKLNDNCIVFSSNHTVSFKGHTGRVLILLPRHSDNNFGDFDHMAEYVTINGMLFLGNYSENLSEEALLKDSIFVLAGSINRGKVPFDR